VRAGLLIRIHVAAASRAVPVTRMPAGRGLAPLAELPMASAGTAGLSQWFGANTP